MKKKKLQRFLCCFMAALLALMSLHINGKTVSAESFGFENSRVDKIYGDPPFTNRLINGYDIDGMTAWFLGSDEIISISQEGEVTILSAGLVSISAYFYEKSEKDETKPGKLKDFDGYILCIKPEMKTEDYNGIYDGQAHSPKIEALGGGTIYYSTQRELTAANFDTDGTKVLPERTDAGETTVYYVVKPQNGLEGKNLDDAYLKSAYPDEFVSGSVTIRVQKAEPILSFDSDSMEKTIDSGDFVNTLAKTTDGEVTFSSSDPSVAVVDSASGMVSVKGSGTTTITAEASAGKNYKSGSVSYTLTVTDRPEIIPVTAIELDKTYLELEEGESEELTASILPNHATNQELSWISNDPELVRVYSDGKHAYITALKEGTATITAITENITADCTVVVTAKENPPEPDKKALIVSVPEDQTVRAGASAAFCVAASGGDSENYIYQWYCAPTALSEGTQIDGAVSADYTIPAREVTKNLDGYFFYCVVKNGLEQVTSKKAKLTVISDIPENPGDSSGGDGSGGDDGGSSGTTPGDSSGGDGSGGDDGGSSGTTPGDSSGGDGNGGDDGGSSGTTPGDSSGGDGNGGDDGGSSGTAPGDSSGNTGGNSGGDGTAKPGDSSGNTGDNSGGSQTTAPGDSTVKLAAPTLKIKLSAANAVQLTWSKVKGASGYNIYRATSKTGKYSKIGTTAGTSYTSKKLKSGKTYYYKVAAYKGNVTGPQSAAVSKKIPKKPAAPKQNKIKINAAQGKFTISWKKIKNADKIEIFRRVDKGKFKKWKTVSAKKRKAAFSYKNYARGHRYSYQLRAYRTEESVILYSGYSNVFTIVM